MCNGVKIGVKILKKSSKSCNEIEIQVYVYVYRNKAVDEIEGFEHVYS